MKVLYIGGTGQISFDCIHESVRAGHEVYVYNRGNHNEGLPDSCRLIRGDIFDEEAYFKLAAYNFDVICQFHLFQPWELARDLRLFTGYCDQYVFISTASAYQKPPRHYMITEEVPLENPFWEYSRNKAEMERLLQAQSALPYTIVRPSHTSRSRLITATGGADIVAQRMLAGKPVILLGDGTSLWTITRSEEFAPPFVKLLGNDGALNDYFHLTSDNAYSWNHIYQALGRVLGVEPSIVHVPTETLIRYRPAWEGPLLGDKTWSALFDNRKIKSVVGDFTCHTTLDGFMQRLLPYFLKRAETYQPDLEYEALLDRIIAEQSQLGR